MSSRGGKGRFHEPGGSASGGHLGPESSGGSLFDPLQDPLPPEGPSRRGSTRESRNVQRERPERETKTSGSSRESRDLERIEGAARDTSRGAGTRGSRGAERTEMFPSRPTSTRATKEQPSKPSAAKKQQTRRRPTIRRVRRTIRHIDPYSVLKLSGFFYAVFLILWLAVVAILYALIDSLGVFDAAEDFGRGLVLWEEVNITLGLVEKWALLIGVLFGVVGTLINTILAVVYNIGADLLGGVEMTFVERDP